jgi:predicted dehydrogenase
MSKVKLASVGLGWWGEVLAHAARDSGEAEIVACFARGEEGRTAFASKIGCKAASSYEELLEDPDVDGVLIATSHQSHRPLIEQAAAAGKAIFVEKPFTLDVEDGAAAVRAADEAGVILQVGHQRRRTPAERRMKAMVDAGDLGDLEAVHGIQCKPNGYKMPDTAWRWDAEQSPLGSMTSLAVHKVDSMLYMAGPVESVFCFTRPGRDVSIDEVTAVSLEFESGAVGTILTSFFTPGITELSLFGTKASAYATNDGATLSVQRVDGETREPIELPQLDPIVDQIAAFARAIRGEEEVEVDGSAGLAVVGVLEAAVKSSETGRAVAIADLM